MKNIHILPTDKPSRLVKNSNENTLKLCIQTLPLDKEIGCIPQNIYITSDEEIKEGDWCLDLYRNKLIQATKDNLEQLHNGGFSTENIKYSKMFKKIILTTDQDLIKDGVQTIDDEFLEWFVKNPICEEVEVIVLNSINVLVNNYKPYYKIIIPKEEPKQIKCYCGHTTYCDCSPLEEPKQETLEEAAGRSFKDSEYLFDKPKYTLGFVEGAKWQQERMYSEEEVIRIVEKSRETGLTAEFLLLIEQFKKK